MTEIWIFEQLFGFLSIMFRQMITNWKGIGSPHQPQPAFKRLNILHVNLVFYNGTLMRRKKVQLFLVHVTDTEWQTATNSLTKIEATYWTLDSTPPKIIYSLSHTMLSYHNLSCCFYCRPVCCSSPLSRCCPESRLEFKLCSKYRDRPGAKELSEGAYIPM